MSMKTMTIRGKVRDDAFYFTLNANGRRVNNMILDTGAFELTFNEQVASALRLPNLGAIQIGGVGGTVQAYQSVCTIQIGNETYSNVPCIVDPEFQEPGLFGLRFFVDNQLSLELNPNLETLTIRSAS
ncbi:retropepsin-like aspartic protease [Pullulanibacillus sp. KACC 23026]|uniref:retropepsin-like aspartic protease n=1 Tax=Pullulanibacillus sp. KACC 23026 TaxID=3028315 RepID=UPI0023B021C6|nr:retropepsin-like aspartic protease [Pullulanibacillus sp. KACC 23026]WEG11020.1 retropepsin-like aspartic protease [Pullulanibacillus sp. KACC 23026]